MTLSYLVDQHIDRHQGSHTTVTEYRAYHAHYIRPLVGRLPLTEIDPGILDQFYEYLAEERHLSPSTIRQVHAIIRGACSRAVRRLPTYLDAHGSAKVPIFPFGRVHFLHTFLCCCPCVCDSQGLRHASTTPT